MPSAALVFRATCGCFHPVYQAFMMKRAKEKVAVSVTVLTPRCCRTDGDPTLGLLFLLLVWGGVLLRCGDVEQNPGPPKQDPMKQTRRVTCGLEASLYRMGRPSGSGQSTPPPPPLPPDPPPTTTLMDVMTQLVTLESSMNFSGETIRMLLVGKTGCGKSETANTILGKKLFKTSLGFGSGTTTQCETLTGFHRHKRIQIMDTPGLFDTYRTQEETCAILVQALVGMHPGPHAVVFVLRAGVRFTQEEYDAYRSLKALFDETVSRYVVLLFSHGDCLDMEQVTLQAMIQHQGNPRSLTTMVEECDHRCVLFNNTTPDNRTQVDTLLQQVAIVMTANQSRPFSCAKYFRIGESLDEEVNMRIKAFEKKDLQRQKYVQELEQKVSNSQHAAEVAHRILQEMEAQREREIAKWKARTAEWEGEVRQSLVQQEDMIEKQRQELERLRRELIPHQVRSMRQFKVDILKEIDQQDNRDVSNLETARRRSERGREDNVDRCATDTLNTGEDSEFLQKDINSVGRPDL